MHNKFERLFQNNKLPHIGFKVYASHLLSIGTRFLNRSPKNTYLQVLRQTCKVSSVLQTWILLYSKPLQTLLLLMGSSGPDICQRAAVLHQLPGSEEVRAPRVCSLARCSCCRSRKVRLRSQTCRDCCSQTIENSPAIKEKEVQRCFEGAQA